MFLEICIKFPLTSCFCTITVSAGVAIIPGTAFGKFATHNVRMNFATSRANISKAIEKIDKILK